jgi:predicted ATPase with chaperone activity
LKKKKAEIYHSDIVEDIVNNSNAKEEKLRCLSTVVGLENARRALEVATVGGHSICIFGEARIGKNTLAECFPNRHSYIYIADKREENKYATREGIFSRNDLVGAPFDMLIECINPTYQQLTRKYETSEAVFKRIDEVKNFNTENKNNTQLDSSCEGLLRNSFEKLNLPIGRYFTLIKVARTIASMEKSKKIEAAHIAEAIQYAYVF